MGKIRLCSCKVGKFRLAFLAMEQEMRSNLRRCAEIYAAARGIGLPTVGRLAAGDWRFFDRLQDGEKTFTARKYDEVIAWFAANWPPEVEWPADVKRSDDSPLSPSDDADSEPQKAAS